MSDPKTQPAPAEHGPGYETSDADVAIIIKYGVAMFAFIFISLALMWALHWGFEKYPFQLEREPTAMELQRFLPPRPHLQVDQSIDLKDLRANEARVLSSYGWVRKEAGAVRIPIDRAIDLISERGLPVTAPPKPAAAKPAAARTK